MKPCHVESRIEGVLHICNRPAGHAPPHVLDLFKQDTAREPVGFGPALAINSQMTPPDSGEREVCKHGGPGGDCAVCVAEREYRVPISHNLAQRILAALENVTEYLDVDVGAVRVLASELRAAVERKP